MANNTTHRVLLQFNDCDARHRKALEILRWRSRSKTDLIVNAVLHYVSCPEAGEEFGREMIRKTVREVLEEMVEDGSLAAVLDSRPREHMREDDTEELSSLMDIFRSEA